MTVTGQACMAVSGVMAVEPVQGHHGDCKHTAHSCVVGYKERG